MKNLFYILLIITTMGCAKETLEKEDLKDDLTCPLDSEKYSEWCVYTGHNYYIGYPEVSCFDSMLISLPYLNDSGDIRYYTSGYIFANYPHRRTVAYVYSEESGLIKNLGFHSCSFDDQIPTYTVFIEKKELVDPKEVRVKIYFYDDPTSYPSDSSYVTFVPWS